VIAGAELLDSVALAGETLTRSRSGLADLT
jgi:hypothetical protein